MSNEHIVRLIRRTQSREKWREDRNTSEKVLKQRRERYANDPEYQESIKESVRRQRQDTAPSNRRRSFNRDKVIIVNGVSVILFSSGKAAHLIGISPRTIRNWEKKGRIPRNRVKDRLGRCWYPAEFVGFLVKQVENRKKSRLDVWSERVKEAWQITQLSDRPIPIVGDHLEDKKWLTKQQ